MHSRNFENENDLKLIRAMLVDARRIAGHRAGYWHVGDLAWRYYMLWYRADPCQSYRLWYDAEVDRLIGYAVFGDDFSFDWQIHPHYAWRGIEEEMLAWTETRWHQAMNDASIPQERKCNLFSGSLENDSQRIAFLERNGFTRGEHPMIHFQRSLYEPIANPNLPDGFIVRGVAGEHEASNRAEAHRQAFEPSRVTDEGYVKLMRMFDYDRELDVVTVSPDGIIAAYGMAWVDAENKIGEFEPVGARDDYLRKGLTRAALLEGLRRMKARGADTANVATNATNVAKGLYESVGFKPVNTEWDYVRK
ncbi:MAG: GNAT family N-acetyltransferase [Chloroflexi bacterium]|nr:GNAT family N-acetyltransferase [Chloroflexota bacterium]